MCNKNHKQKHFTGICKSWHNLFKKRKQILSINLLALQFLTDMAASAAIGLSGVQFGLLSYEWIGRHEVQLPINHKSLNFREKKNSQVMKEKENLRYKTDKGRLI